MKWCYETMWSSLILLLLWRVKITESFIVPSSSTRGRVLPSNKNHNICQRAWKGCRNDASSLIRFLSSLESDLYTESTSSNENDCFTNISNNNVIYENYNKKSKNAKEFYSMMCDFRSFAQSDIDTIDDVRYRALYEGVAAGATVPDVLKAFGVLYEDFTPIRLAGRMIYRHLKTVMEKNIHEKKIENEKISNMTGLSYQEIESGRKAFMAILDEGGCEGKLSMDQLVQSGIVNTVVELLGYDTFEEFQHKMDLEGQYYDKNGMVNFEKFMVGLQRCKDGSSCHVQCDLTQVFDEIVKRMNQVELTTTNNKKRNEKMTKIERKQKYSDRYDEMLVKFEEWESYVPMKEGRYYDVLRGCFAGAKNEKVVAALKIVYMDYSALRIGGNLVFTLMSTLVKRQ